MAKKKGKKKAAKKRSSVAKSTRSSAVVSRPNVGAAVQAAIDGEGATSVNAQAVASAAQQFRVTWS
ncbi:MAG: hypothetical protein JSR77_12630 [Planctomycetes bacterium]|nr:hypothetical protein [Planctomycetota bacterium]